MVKVASVNVSRVRTFEVPDGKAGGIRKVRSAILKEPVPGRVWLRELGLEGDAQADHRFHGGPDKAVYLYSSEHYVFWSERLELPLPPGTFGDNLTIEGWGALEEALHVGDTLMVGNAKVELTTPRQPCWKLEARMGIQGFAHAFIGSGRIGVYARVLAEGEVGAGDEVRVAERLEDSIPLALLIRALYFRDEAARARALASSTLPPKMRRRLERAGANDESEE